MALFKILRGNSANLPKELKDGWAYVTTDEHKMYVDCEIDGSVQRICLNDNGSVQSSIGSLCWITDGTTEAVYSYTMSGTTITQGEKVADKLSNCQTDEYLGKWFLVLGGTEANPSTKGQTSYPSTYTIDGANGQLNIRDYVVWAGRWVHINLYESKASTIGDAGGYDNASGVDGLMSSTQAAHLSDLIEDLWHPRSNVVEYNAGSVNKPGFYTGIVSGRPETDTINGLFIKNSKGELSQIVVSENNNNLWFRGSNKTGATGWQKVASYDPKVFTTQVGFMPLYNSADIWPNWADQGIHYGILKDDSSLGGSRNYHLISTGAKPASNNDGSTGQIAIGVGDNTGIMQYRGKGGSSGGAAWNNVVHIPNDTSGTLVGVGSSTKPVYINSTGVPTACDSSLNVNITGNAATATKATQDSEGNTIVETYAPIYSPEFTGIPKAPTAVSDENSGQIATTAFVQTKVAELVNGAPEQLNTLKELADALGNDENLATSITEQIGQIKANYLPLAGGTMTGALNLSGPDGINISKEGLKVGYYFANPAFSSANLISQPFSPDWFDRLAFLKNSSSSLDQAEIFSVEYKDSVNGEWITEAEGSKNKILTLFNQKSDAYQDTTGQCFLTTEGNRFGRRFTILNNQYNYSNLAWLVLYAMYSNKGTSSIRVQIERVQTKKAEDGTITGIDEETATEIFPSPVEISEMTTSKNHYLYLGKNAVNTSFAGLRFAFELIPQEETTVNENNYTAGTYYTKDANGNYIQESEEANYSVNTKYYLYQPCEMRLTNLKGLSTRKDSQGVGPSIELPFLWDNEQNIQAKITPINTPKTGAYWNGVPLVSQYGAMEVGKYIDFHNTNTSTNNYDTRLQSTNKEGTTVTINLPKTDGTLALTDDVLYTNTTGTTATIGGINKGTKFENTPIKDIIEQLLYPYVAPKITLKKANDDPSVFELGVGATLTFTTTVTQGSSTISAVDLYDSNNNKQITEWTNKAGTQTSSAINITNTTTFVAKVTDGKNKTISSSKVTITGVDPFFYGTVSTAPTTSENINALTKKVETKDAKTYDFTTDATNNRYCICYPKSYGTLTTILDANGFDNTADFTRTEVTRSRTSAVNDIKDITYYVYTYNNVIISGVNTSFTFKFS